MISLPFTISAVILIVACSISKIQYSSTYMAIAVHAFLGPLQTASLVTTVILYIQSNQPKNQIKILFIAALTLIGMYNCIAFVVQTPLLAQDRKFLKWLRRRDFQKSTKFNLYWFYFISASSLFSNYKLKMLLFSRLFSFDCLKCQLQDLQKFKLINIFIFLGLIPQIIVLYCASVQVLSIDSSLNIYFSLIDIIIIVLGNIVFSLLSVIKQKDFFKESIDGVIINKVINLAQQSFQTSVKIGAVTNGYSLDDIIQVNQNAYVSTKRDIVNINNHKQTGEQVEQKLDIEGLSEQNTVTDRYSENRNVDQQIFKQRQYRNMSQKVDNLQKAEETNNNNILMVDQYFSFGSENNDNQLQNFENYQVKQNPIVQINRKAQVLQQPQLFSSQQGLTQQVQDQTKIKKINLTDYLIKVENKMQLQKKKHQSSLKYDIVDLEITNEEVEEWQKQENTKIGRFVSQIVDEQILQNLPQDETFFIDNQPSINCRSEPPGTKYCKQVINTNSLQSSLFQNAIKKVVTNHQLPKKEITQNIIQRRNKHISTKNTQFQLNEDHQQQTVTNKSKQKIKSVYNHPIKTTVNKKPTQPPNKILADETQNFIQYKKSNKSPHRENLKIKAIDESFSQIKSIERQEDPVYGKVHNTIREDSFFKQFLKHQDKTEEKQEAVKEFKRSDPQSLTFFPHKMRPEVQLHQHDQLNFPPRKPIESIMQKLKQRFSAKTRQKTQVPRSNGIFYSSSKSANRNKSSESKRQHLDSLKRKESTQIYRTESYFSEEKTKKYSLQKIYLQKLTR